MTTAAALGACFLLAALAVFQAALIAGRPLGRFAWGGQHEILPRSLRIGSAVSILLYAVFVILILERAHLSQMLPDAVAGVGTWVLTGYLTLGIFLNLISRSKPERIVMTPVCAALAGLCLVVALS
jgi:hypothetical protein